MSEKNAILFTVHHRGESHQIQTNPNEYYSLMTLLSDKFGIPGFGLCCGMGSCGTCMVQISNQYSFTRTVLACGTLVNDELSNTHITIPDKIY